MYFFNPLQTIVFSLIRKIPNFRFIREETMTEIDEKNSTSP